MPELQRAGTAVLDTFASAPGIWPVTYLGQSRHEATCLRSDLVRAQTIPETVSGLGFCQTLVLQTWEQSKCRRLSRKTYARARGLLRDPQDEKLRDENRHGPTIQQTF